MKIDCIAGARPNFMKVAPIVIELGKRPDLFSCRLIHTGQHSDPYMSDVFFRDLGLREPDINLGISSGTHGEATGRMLIELEKIFIKNKPDWVLVVGDVNSTLAAALAAAKLQIPIGHVESGLRSFNRTMPEEINRIIVDHLSTVLFTHEESARENLLKEGIKESKIISVGNTMIDSLKRIVNTKSLGLNILDQLGVQVKQYILVTLHRPENVDSTTNLKTFLDTFEQLSEKHTIVWPVHPRTRQRLDSFGYLDRINGMKDVLLTQPQGYADFVNLMMNTLMVLTDSGGIQEETTYLKIPCVTLRNETERPITIKQGTNRIAGIDRKSIMDAVLSIDSKNYIKQKDLPPMWDGRASFRIVKTISKLSATI